MTIITLFITAETKKCPIFFVMISRRHFNSILNLLWWYVALKKESYRFCCLVNYFSVVFSFLCFVFNSDWHISTSRDPSKKKYNHKSLLVGLYHDKKSWFRPKIKKLILARSQNHAFSNHAFSTLLRFQNNMLVRNLAITMHFLGVNGLLWMKSTS